MNDPGGMQESHFYRRGRLLVGLLLVLLVTAGLMWGLAGGERQRVLRAVHATIDPAIDGTQSLGDMFRDHPHLTEPLWTAGWSNNNHMVAVEVRLARFADLQQFQTKLLAPFMLQVSKNPSWVGVAGEQPAVIQVVFVAKPGDDGAFAVQIASLRLTEVWVQFKPEGVEDYEKALEVAIDNADDSGRARKYRLRHEGDQAFFNAGLDGPMLAGPGLESTADVALATLVRWR